MRCQDKDSVRKMMRDDSSKVDSNSCLIEEDLYDHQYIPKLAKRHAAVGQW